MGDQIDSEAGAAREGHETNEDARATKRPILEQPLAVAVISGLLAAVIGSAVSVALTLHFSHSGPSDRVRAAQAHQIANGIAQTVGRPFPASIQQRFVKLLMSGNDLYAHGRWKESRMSYEAMFRVLTPTCTARSSAICQLIDVYRAAG